MADRATARVLHEIAEAKGIVPEQVAKLAREHEACTRAEVEAVVEAWMRDTFGVPSLAPDRGSPHGADAGDVLATVGMRSSLDGIAGALRRDRDRAPVIEAIEAAVASGDLSALWHICDQEDRRVPLRPDVRSFAYRAYELVAATEPRAQRTGGATRPVPSLER